MKIYRAAVIRPPGIWIDGQALRDRHCRKIAPMAAITGKPLRRVSRNSSSSFPNLLRRAS
jgi:hypothetical protein